jgi:cell division protein FtsI/penicillin-binding protein 2
MYRNAKPINWVALRIALVALIFAAGTVLLVVRVYRLQVSHAEPLKEHAAKLRTRVPHLEARRGMILDRSGDQMAASLEVDSIYARPRKIKAKRLTAHKLAELLGVDENDVLRKLDDSRSFVWIKRRVSPLGRGKDKTIGFARRALCQRIQTVLPTEEFSGPCYRICRYRLTGPRGFGTVLR